MKDRFIVHLGYVLIGIAFILVFCGLIFMANVNSWMFFPLALGSMVTGISINHLMRSNKQQKEMSG